MLRLRVWPCALTRASLARLLAQALRALFPLVAGAMGELKYLEKAVSLVLGFIGAKMVADFGGYHISTGVSLAVVASALAAGVGLSLALPDEEKQQD